MDQPNILWLTLDSVRADHTSIDGYERDTTPELSRLAENGYASANCFSHGKSTLTASGTILTGLAPSRNTLGISGRFLPDAVRTVSGRFSDVGYQTALLSRNSFVSDATGLDRGFDRSQWLSAETIWNVGPKILLNYLLNVRSHSAGLTRDTAKHATPYLMNEMAKRWLDDFDDDVPFFFYLHYNEPHRPYYPPLSYIDKYSDDLEMTGREAAELALEIHKDLKEIVATGCEIADQEWAALRAMYDAEIAYTDEMIGRLVDYVRSEISRDTIVVVTGDHGELFGEYGLMSHKYVLIDAVTRVPLVVDGIDETLAVEPDEIIQHADVMTTLLAMAGANICETVGVDLREQIPAFAVSQRGPAEFDDLYKYNGNFDATRFHHPTLTALRTEEYRYQCSEEDEDLFSLPDEETDVSDDHPDVVKDLSTELDEWLKTHGTPIGRGDEQEFSAAVRRQLQDLGYVD